MKKILAIFLTLVLMLATLPMGLLTLTANAATSGTTGDCVWKLDGTELTISGTGKMGDYDNDTRPWGNDITKVTIKEGVTSIGVAAFSECSLLTSIDIPYGVTSIGICAFSNCSSLTEVNIPDSVTSIDFAFGYCTSLKSIVIPDGVTHIVNSEFYGCTALTSVVIPDSVTRIELGAFNYCTSLTSITIPDSVTHMEAGVFAGCTSLTSITMPERAMIIEPSSFHNTGYYNNIENWEDGVLYIGKHLIDTKPIVSGTCNIKNGTLSIAGYAFLNNPSLTTIVIPSSVKEGIYNVFVEGIEGYANIKTVYYGGTEAEWNEITSGYSGEQFLNADIRFSHSLTMVKEGSIRKEKGSGKNYSSAGVRYKSRLSKEMHESATEIGFVAVPTSFLNGMTITEYVEMEGNVAMTAMVKGDGMEEMIYAISADSNGNTYYDYQMIITALTRENVTQNMLDTEISVAMYAVIDGERMYTDTMAYSFNYILSLMNQQ